MAGAAINENGALVTKGGRVLGVTAVADTLEDALCESYRMVEKIGFANKYYRHDIGKRALEAGRI